MLYDANGAGLNLDFTPVNTFTISLWVDHYGHLRPTIFKLTFIDDSGLSSSVTRTYSSYLTIGDWREETFSITDFTGNADLANINSFQFEYVGDYANDVDFDYIKTDAPPVPIPGSILLLGTGLLGLVAVGFRRKT